MDIKGLVQKQNEYFRTGETRTTAFRLAQLKKLYNAVKENEAEIAQAMKMDMNKAPSEVYMTETGLVLEELRYHMKNISRWNKRKRVSTPLAQFAAKSFTAPEPYGTALIMSPWNYPIQLCLEPLIGAISAGCTAIVKPSAYAENSSKIIGKILGETFDEKYIAVVQGGRSENSQLLEQAFDYIFFTGSPAVGHMVMESAAKHLTPITLELGGKSPVIVDASANIKLAARRIAFGKVLNGGQTCVEPDYLLIQKTVKDKFVEEFRNALHEFFPDGDMSDMNVIINEKHYQRVKRLLDSGTAVVGGNYDDSRRFIAPTLLDDVEIDSPVMQEEIFGPILPMIPFDKVEECVDYIADNPKPLALYLFTNQKEVEDKILNSCSFGGGCINDTIIHLATSKMGFGGVGASGMGDYHGKKSFDTFTHYRSIVKKANWLDLPVRYRPYSIARDKLLRLFLH